MQLSTFVIDGETFGVPTLLVEELFRPLPVTVVPTADPRIEGLVNIRGRTAVVLNMRLCLRLPPPIEPVLNEMILLETVTGLVEEAHELGLTAFDEPIVLQVDSTKSIHLFDRATLHAAPAHVSQQFVEGVAQIDGKTVTVISPKKLIDSILKAQLGETE